MRMVPTCRAGVAVTSVSRVSRSSLSVAVIPSSSRRRRRRATANCGLGRLGEDGRRSDSKASDGIVTPYLVVTAEGGPRSHQQRLGGVLGAAEELGHARNREVVDVPKRQGQAVVVTQ